ncbi:MAG: HNH endonuclease signature motif containing protein [Thermodesulfobacteriota bacterium]
MTSKRNKDQDREETQKLILNPNRSEYSGGSNWLGHGKNDGECAVIDYRLLDGATMNELKNLRGAIYEHLSHLKREHGLPYEKVVDKYRFKRDILIGPQDALTDLEEHKSEYENATEKEAIIQARIGQGKFRENLLKRWQSCSVTGCQEVKVLRASHIKPWRDCTNEERLDIDNGLLLAPNIDALFDVGLISFDDKGSILFSPRLTAEDKKRLSVNHGLRLKKVYPGSIKYLAEHRKLHQYPP